MRKTRCKIRSVDRFEIAFQNSNIKEQQKLELLKVSVSDFSCQPILLHTTIQNLKHLLSDHELPPSSTTPGTPAMSSSSNLVFLKYIFQSFPSQLDMVSLFYP